MVCWNQPVVAHKSQLLNFQVFCEPGVKHNDYDGSQSKNIYTMEISKHHETGFLFLWKPIYQHITLSNSQFHICLVSGNLVSANIII